MSVETPKRLQLFEEEHVSKLYSAHRPSVPTEIVETAIQFTRQKIAEPFKQLAEVGCGSGQATRKFSKYFRKVLATDISKSQIQQALCATSLENVTYRVSPAETIPIEDSSVDLVLACVCFHYFDQVKFLKEACRVLRPNGVLAIPNYVIDFDFDDAILSKKFDFKIEDATDLQWNHDFFKILTDEMPLTDTTESLGVIQAYRKCKGEEATEDLLREMMTWYVPSSAPLVCYTILLRVG
ncbi:putative methyltransferase [Nymphon striatum]|nr:putative methyltransferase [Nymphon striatum]